MEYKKNDIVTVTIEDMGTDGEGIGKVDGYTLFVKDTVIGDVAEVKLVKLKKNYGYARLMRIITPSADRVEAKCEYAKQCGGCQIQFLSYEKQLEFKRHKVQNHLTRIGGLENVTVQPVIGMEEPFYYRNKAQFPIGTDKEGNPIAGFYAGRTHSIIANTNCHLGVSVNETILNMVLDYMREEKVPAYDENTGKGCIRHVLIRVGFTTGEIMVCLIVNGNKLVAADKLVERLTTIPKMTSITLNVNTERTNVILGKKLLPLWGETTIRDYIGDICYRISPLSFYQVNPVQTKKLYDTALEFAGLTGEETVWDLYCGIGTISLFLAQRAKMVYGVEIVPQAIEDAKFNAELNGIKNAEFYVGKAEEVLPEMYEKEGVYADVIVVDPPRKGCDETLLATMVQMQPKRIVYVSCDSATLARDLKYLCGEGYAVVRVQPVDMFPQGVHVETVVLLSQQKPDDYVEVELELDELDLTSAESKATYSEIKDYVLKKHGVKVSNLYISQVKRKCGIEVGENYNLRKATRRMDCLQADSTTAANLENDNSQGMPKSADSRQPQCPVEKEKAIRDALEHFGMI